MQSRRIVALMFTDIVGYSAMAHQNEIRARSLVNEQRKIIRQALVSHGGREHDTAGDGFFIEFSSAVQALESAIEIQSLLFDRNRTASHDRQLQIRIGIHVGDIVAQNEDLFGDGVNVAARIEPLADPGGICVTQQVYDQVMGKISGLQFVKLGHRKLKNIASGAVVYSVVTPWTRQAVKRSATVSQRLKRLPLFENMSSMVGGLLFGACLTCLLVATLVSTSMGLRDSDSGATRLPAAVGESNAKVDLSEGWFYQVAQKQNAQLETQVPNDAMWQPFNPKNSWDYSEKISGKYWLKKRFNMQAVINTPAIVLGLISGSHRLYLNGLFIGGAGSSGELVAYSFDQSLLNVDSENELLVAAESRASLNPGLTLVPSITPFVGNFKTARDAVALNQVRFVILRTVYFSGAVLIFFIAFAYAIFRRSSRRYFYYAFVLLLGAVQLTYFNPLVAATFDYPFTRFLRALGLVLTPLILMSCYLSDAGKTKTELRRELLNNAFAFCLAIGIALYLFEFSSDTIQFTKNFNGALLTGAVYAAGALILLAFAFAEQLWKRAVTKLSIFNFSFYLLFQMLAFVGLISALKRGVVSSVLSPGIRDAAIQITMATPLLFALAVVVIATVDYVRQSHASRHQQRRNDFSLEVLHLIHGSSNTVQSAFEIHQKLADFLLASRSTLYILEGAGQAGDNSLNLRMANSIGRQHSSGDLSARSLQSHPVLNHVLSTLTPVLIRDMKTDLRFAQHPQKAGERSKGYKTGSCIVVPLRSSETCLGLLTFADKSDQTSFTDADFSSALEVASTIALLIANAPPTPSRLQEPSLVA